MEYRLSLRRTYRTNGRGGGISLSLPGGGWQVKQTRRSFLARKPGNMSLSLKIYGKKAVSPDDLARSRYKSYKMITGKKLVRKQKLKTARGFQIVTYVGQGKQKGQKVMLGFSGILNSKTGKYYYLKCFWKDGGAAGNRRNLNRVRKILKTLK